MSKITSEAIKKLSLDDKDILLHQSRIQAVAEGNVSTALPVEDTCRIDNGGIISSEKSATIAASSQSIPTAKFLAFVPAAGAASRYFKPLADIEAAIQAKDHAAADAAIQQLLKQGGAEWALPPYLRECLQSTRPGDFALEHADKLQQEMTQAKALQPATVTGESYLQIKNEEHQKMSELAGQLFVVPFEQSSLFAERTKAMPGNLPTFFLEQGPDLSTIRFKPSGEPYLEPATGGLSPVPAGHGTLAKLFPKAKQLVEDTSVHSLFIRNIDNINGTSEAVLTATSDFLALHDFCVTQLRKIRGALGRGDRELALEIGRQWLQILQPQERRDDREQAFLNSTDEFRDLWRIQVQVFHTSPALIEAMLLNSTKFEVLKQLYERPLNCLGQVPNSGKDVGGSPVFTEKSGQGLAICLELPHASQEDVDTFLANPDKATHFNPVFVASELCDREDQYFSPENPFWILAKKRYQGQDVVYHETVLYELLGNSMLANPMFIEIPRILFNPHKTLADTRGRKLSDWLKQQA